MRANALLASMPRGPAPAKQDRFKGGAIRSSTFAPRGLGYYDAFASTPDATVLSHSVGPCTPIEGYARLVVPGAAGVSGLNYDIPSTDANGATITVSAQATTNSKLIVFNCGSSDSEIARCFELVPDTNDPTRAMVHVTPVLASAFGELGPAFGANPGGPGPHHFIWSHMANADNPDRGANGHFANKIESIPLRGSVCIRNITEHFSVGGEVRMMRYNGGMSIGGPLDLPYDPAHLTTGPGADEALFGVNDFLEMCDMMRDTKRATTYSADELLATHQMNTYPADAIRAQTFHNDTTFHESCLTPKFCSLIILIDDFKSSAGGTGIHAVNNTYSLSFVAHRAARFRPGTLLHHKATTLPVDPGAHHRVTTTETLRPVAVPVKTNGSGGTVGTAGQDGFDITPYLVGAGTVGAAALTGGASLIPEALGAGELLTAGTLAKLAPLLIPK